MASSLAQSAQAALTLPWPRHRQRKARQPIAIAAPETGQGPIAAARLRDVGRIAKREAEPQARKPVEFSERAQNQQPGPPRLRRKRQLRNGIGKTLVNDETADARQQRQQIASAHDTGRRDCWD